MPFFLIAALFIGGLILGLLLMPKAKIENAKASQLSDFQFPRSNEGDPLPRIYGTVKTKGVNTIGQCKFKAKAIKKKVKTGLFSSKKVTTGYEYYCGIDLAVALGPGAVFRRLWYGNHLIWAGCLFDMGCVNRFKINLPELLGGKDKQGGIKGWVAFYCGAFDQPQNAYLQANLSRPEPDDIISAYPGVVHMVFEDFWWGNSPNILTVSVEIAYFTNSLGLSGEKHVMPNGLDANPVEVLYDLYVNDWGNLGIQEPIFNLDSWRAAAYQIWKENNGISCEIANPQTGADVSKNILRQINGVAFQNPQTGQIDLVLMRKDYDIETLPVLGPNEINSLRNFTKKLWEDTINRVRIKYRNRDNDYQDGVAAADDFGNIRYQGRIRSTDIGMPMCYRSDLANELAARELSNLNVPLYGCEIQMDRTHSDLTPGKCFVLNWPEYNITGIVMRIRKMGLGTRKDGQITLTVTQDEFSADAVVSSPPVVPVTDSDDYGPTDVSQSLTFEVPYWMAAKAGDVVTAGRTYYATLAKKPGYASIDYFVYIDDPEEDIEAVENAPYANTAQIVTTLWQFEGFTTGIIDELVIKNVTDATVLKTSTVAQIQNDGRGTFMLNGEILAYEDFVDNGDTTYTLLNVHRALLDTTYTGAVADDAIYFFDGQEGFWDTDVAATPFSAYVIDRAYTGRSAETDATHMALTPVERASLPLPPDNITIESVRSTSVWFYAGTATTIDWSERNRTNPLIQLETDATEAPESGTTYDIEVRRLSDNSLLFDDTGIAATTYELTVDPMAEPGGIVVELFAVKDGHRSFTAGLFPATILSPESLVVDGDPVLIDGYTVEFD